MALIREKLHAASFLRAELVNLQEFLVGYQLYSKKAIYFKDYYISPLSDSVFSENYLFVRVLKTSGTCSVNTTRNTAAKA